VSVDAEKWLTAAETRSKIVRDNWGRPLIEKPDGTIGAYTRASTLGKALEDQTGLTKWLQRQAVIGVAQRKDLVLAAVAHKDDNQKMNEIIETGMEVAGSSAAATTGTALHDLCDQYDHGQEPYVPEEFEADVAAYLEATAPLEVVAAEQFAVCDELEVGGTPDRIMRLWAPVPLPDGTELPVGTLVVVDIKTGKTLDFGHIGFSVQFAVYSRSYRYDLSFGRTRHYGRLGEIPVGDRVPWVEGEKVNREWGLVVHLPSGKGTATVHPINLSLGWELAQLSRDVREWRKRKDIIAAPVKLKEDFQSTLAAAESVRDLRAAHKRAVRAGKWDKGLQGRFTARKEELLEDAA
jgi:hypothetical protein